MAKTIDRHRLIQAMEKTSAYKEKITDPIMDVLRVSCSVGLRSKIHQSFGNPLDLEIENGRTQAILAYHGLEGSTPESFKRLWNIVNPIFDRRRHFYQKIAKIQERHQISGLHEEAIVLGDCEVKILANEEPLVVLDSDLDTLREAKSIQFFNLMPTFSQLKTRSNSAFLLLYHLVLLGS